MPLSVSELHADSPVSEPRTPALTLSPKLSDLPRIPELDGIRGLAAFWVLLYHYFGAFKALGIFGPVVLMGWRGVDLFFTLSGFLIGMILAHHRTSPNLFSAFYMRRLFRVIPLYYLLITTTFVLEKFVVRNPPPATVPYWSYFILLNDFVGYFLSSTGPVAIAWSLAIEEKFYLLAPLISRFFGRRAQVAILLSLLAASVGRQWWLFTTYGPEVTFAKYIYRWEGICLGMLVALYTAKVGLSYWKTSKGRLWIIVPLLLAFLLQQIAMESAVVTYATNYTRACLVFVAVLLFTLGWEGTVATRVLRSRPLTWLGSISYGVYLLHLQVQFVMGSIGYKLGVISGSRAEVLLTFGMLITTLLLAHFSWKFFESRFVEESRRRFRYS